jgi:simple sugar transport system substrate-binding protein
VSLDRGELLRRALAAVGAGTLGGSASNALASSAQGQGNFPAHPSWRFVFVSHLTTTPLFVPLQYGAQDACALVGCTYSWTGSATGDFAETARAIDAAVSAEADGLAVEIGDAPALSRSVEAALAAGIPVVAFQANVRPVPNVALVGQDAHAAGWKIGTRIGQLVKRGSITLFAGEPEDEPLRLRLRGALAAIRRTSPAVRATVVATTRDPYEASARIQRHLAGSKSLRGAFALEAVASEALGHAVVDQLRGKGLRAGGYGVFPATLDLIAKRELDFTVDEQPYLQGFVPVLQLFLTKLSGGLLAPATTLLPVQLVTTKNLARYQATTRYEGSSSRPRYPIS